MSLGSLTVSLGLDAASFVQGITKSEQQAKRFAQTLSTDLAGAARFVGLTGGAFLAAAGAVAIFVKSQSEAIDRFNDVADATGATIENLSALENVARKNGGSLNTAADVLVKFNSVLKDLEPKGSAAQIFKNLGLDAEELKKLDPAEALRQTAVAFDQFNDGGSKARNVQELFGKSIREAGPFLKDLAEQQKLVGTQTTAAAQEAERFNKNLSELKTAAEDAGRAIANQLIPPINRFVADAKTGGFAQAMGLDGFGDKITQTVSAFKLLQLAGERALIFDKTTPDAIARLQAIDDEAKRLAASLTKARDAMLKIGEGAGRRPPNEGGGGLRSRGKRTLPDPPPKTTAVDEAARYIESLRKEALAVEDLSKAQEVLAELQGGGRLAKATARQVQIAQVLAEQIDAQRMLGEELKAGSEQSAAWVRAQQDGIDAAHRFVEAADAQNQALRDEAAIITGGESARRAIEQARLSSAVATKEQDRALRELHGASERELQLLDDEIAKLRERAGLLQDRNTAADGADELAKRLRDSEELARSVKGAFSDTFTDFITGAKSAESAVKAFSNAFANILIRRSSESLADSIFGTTGAGGKPGWLDSAFGSGGAGSFLATLFGGGKAIGGPTMPNTLYQVGERRPEVYDDGSRQWLLTGSRRGNINPSPGMGGGSRTLNAPITINVPPGTSRATASQVGGDVARHLAALNARMN